jgi:hypothetical protein
MKQLYRHNDKVYVILRKLSHHNLTDKQGNIISGLFNAWKEYLGADHVLRDSTHFMFCETVLDVDWEDLPEETEQ